MKNLTQKSADEREADGPDSESCVPIVGSFNQGNAQEQEDDAVRSCTARKNKKKHYVQREQFGWKHIINWCFVIFLSTKSYLNILMKYLTVV